MIRKLIKNEEERAPLPHPMFAVHGLVMGQEKFAGHHSNYLTVSIVRGQRVNNRSI